MAVMEMHAFGETIEQILEDSMHIVAILLE